MIFKENLTEILDGIRPFLLPLNSYIAKASKTYQFANQTILFSYFFAFCINMRAIA